LTAGMGVTAADQLRKVGFSIPDGNVSNAGTFDFAQTTIRYLPGSEAHAQQVASYLESPPILEEVPYLINAEVSVVIGADWKGVRSAPGPTVPLPTTTTTTVPGRRGTTTTTTTTTATTVPGASTSSTTTTTLGVVPETPQDVRC
jgi:LytR cell envelope-related transcriptional attenuator